ncbi:MAG: polymerase [Patescibacteria group bacterium]|nr:DNA polymerase I [Candidatus Saccharibacteria bacterium]MDQ5963374.1 polymerase [Patescibacteria group bacterium]
MAKEVQPKRLVVIDGKSVFYRGYYAMGSLATKDGTPTGGVFGFATMALEVIRKLKPDYVAVAWDKPKTNIRKRLEIYPEYKAGRKPAPPDFYEQIPVLHELLGAFGWPLYELDDFEADDIMGTLAVQAREQGLETLLVTSDMDMLQLVNGNVKVYALKKGLSNIELYSPESFTAKYQIDVDQFLDLKALKGDSSDNIPGVPGIGEKTAIQLLLEYKTLDGVYDNLWQIKESVRKKLEAGKELAYMSKKLGAIWCDAPLPLDLKSMNDHRPNPEKIMELLQKLEFKSLVRQVPSILGVELQPQEGPQALQDFSGGKTTYIQNQDELAGVKLANGDEIVVVSRNAGMAGRDPLTLVISNKPSSVYAVDLTKVSLDEAFLTQLAECKLVGYDLKSTFKMLLDLGMQTLPTVSHDVLLTSFVENSLRRDLSLSELGGDVGYDGSSFADLSTEEFIERAAQMVAIIRALTAEQRAHIHETPTLEALVQDVDGPVVPVLARMEYEGILLDTTYLKDFAEQINDKISDLEQEIYGHADSQFNIASPAQLAVVLFEDLGLPTQGIKKGKTGYSTAASELDKLRHAHPITDLISQYREVTKLKNTYIDTLPRQVDGHGRVHTTFNMTVAQTGRLSSEGPNLQNIPVRTELGKHIRTAFVAGKGRKLVSADYSQFELRLAAAMSGDTEMIDMFNRGADIHMTTAAQVYGREQEDVTKQMRSAAKTINFGVLYGMSPHGLAAATGMTFTAAKEFIDEYFKLRAPLLGYLDGLKEKARTDGYVETLLGRRRPMPDIKSSNFIVRSAAERAAMNMPIQGTEADLMKLAMVAVDKELGQFEGAKQLLQIHDSILVECAEEDAEAIAKSMQQTMESIYELPVALAVDTSIGDNWGEL